MPIVNTEIELSLFVEPVKAVITYLYNNHKWFSIFKKTIKENEGHDITSVLLNDSAIKRISKVIKKTNGFGLKEKLFAEFSAIFSESNVDINNYSEIVNNMIDALINGIKGKYPNIYRAYIEDDNHDMIETIYSHLIQNNEYTSLTNLNSAIDRFDFNNSAEIKITIDFFDFNDIKTEEAILQKINDNENIFIKYYCVEEALLRLWNLLKNRNIKNAVVINNVETWEQFSQSNEKGYILIPNFQYKELKLIEDNVNIIVNDGLIYHENDDEYLELRRRTKRNIVDSLVKIGLDSDLAYKYVKDTNGLYYPLMTKLLKDKYVFENGYEYDKSDEIALQYLVLINKFSIDDIGFISEYFEIADPQRIVRRYTTGLNPLFIERRGRDNKQHYSVAYYDSAFYQFTRQMSELMFKKFIDFALIAINKKERSKYLVDGVIDSLIKIHYLGKENHVRSYGHEKLNSFIATISNVESFNDYSNILIELVNICPDCVLDKLESIASDNPEGLAKTITPYSGDLVTIFKRLIIKSQFVKPTLKLCLELYQYNDSFKSFLQDVFCPWYNNLPQIYSDKKVELVSELLKLSQKFMDIIEHSLPRFSQGTIVVWNEPDYMDEDIDHAVSIDIYKNTVNGYINLCLDNINGDYSRIVSLLDDITVFDDQIIKKYISIVQDALVNYDDLQRAKYSYEVVRLINKHRYFKDSGWALGEDRLVLFEQLLDSIKYDSPEYEYYYLFERDYESILLHPTPYKEDNYKQDNDKQTYELRLQKYKEYLDKGYELKKLISMYEKDSCLGLFIAATLDKKDLLCFLDTIIENDRTPSLSILRRFCFSLNRDDLICFELMVNHIRKTTNDKNIIMTVLESLYGHHDSLIEIVDSFSDDIKFEYWHKRRIYSNSFSVDEAKLILDRAICYGNKATYLDYLNDFTGLFDKTTLLHYIMNIRSVRGDVNSNEIYDFETIIKSFEPGELDDEQCKAMAEIEIDFSELLNWEDMIFSNYCFSKDPIYYIKIVLNNFDKNITFDDTYLDDRYTYSLYYKTRFCPGVIDDEFDESIFHNWINIFYDVLRQYYDDDFIDDMIGGLLAFSPVDDDGFPPLKPVRVFIEEKNSKPLNVAYAIAEQDKRGAYTLTEGVDEMRLSNKYKELAERLKELGYPVCSNIYKMISRSYAHQSDLERESVHD